MTLDPGVANLELACALVDQLATSGVHHAVICPGSRSTPIAVSLASHPDIQTWVLVDERAAAFFALGMARQLNAPVVILSTSGTAAANFLPAVVEARLSRIPLIVLTADRPPELRDWGAAQTIDQIQLFGSHVKWFVDMPVPVADDALVRHARATAARAVQTARSHPAGPVHLNLPFREPLLPADLRPSWPRADFRARLATVILLRKRSLANWFPPRRHSMSLPPRLRESREGSSSAARGSAGSRRRGDRAQRGQWLSDPGRPSQRSSGSVHTTARASSTPMTPSSGIRKPRRPSNLTS